MNPILHLLSTLPNFLAYLGTALGLTILFSILYTAVTPQAEWKMLREGNISASLAFGGALLGFVIPLASAIAHSVSLLDTVVWGFVALIVQLVAFFGVWLILPRLPRQIEEDHRGVATIAAVFFLSVGLLNAACLVW
ncbi:MAG TPA: DUF350 domain-containing protein [Fibrobacteria bacterium]|nr:DUF350 domain-containing protein [Fibrobacteria bacterium]